MLPDSHLPRHVTIASRHFREAHWVQALRISFLVSTGQNAVVESVYRKSRTLVHLTSHELKLSGDEIQTFVKRKTRQIKEIRVGSKKNLFASKLKARDSTADSFPKNPYPQWRNLRRTAKFHVIM